MRTWPPLSVSATCLCLPKQRNMHYGGGVGNFREWLTHYCIWTQKADMGAGTGQVTLSGVRERKGVDAMNK